MNLSLELEYPIYLSIFHTQSKQTFCGEDLQIKT